jgi:arylsulfatase A-like enzyme
MDLYVTLAGLCGVPVPADRAIDGVDIAGLLRGGAGPAPRDFYWALPTRDGRDYAFRRGDWKLIFNTAMEPVELYDLARDPLELINRLKGESARVTELTAAFRAHHAAVLADPLRPKDMEQTNR